MWQSANCSRSSRVPHTIQWPTISFLVATDHTQWFFHALIQCTHTHTHQIRIWFVVTVLWFCSDFPIQLCLSTQSRAKLPHTKRVPEWYIPQKSNDVFFPEEIFTPCLTREMREISMKRNKTKKKEKRRTVSMHLRAHHSGILKKKIKVCAVIDCHMADENLTLTRLPRSEVTHAHTHTHISQFHYIGRGHFEISEYFGGSIVR